MSKKGAPEGPEGHWRVGQYPVAAVVVGQRQDDQATVDWECSQFDRKARSFSMRKCGSDLGPSFLGLAIVFILFDLFSHS